MEKSAFRTTLAHGPGQAAGGVTEKGLGEKSAKATLLNSVTTQGVVLGRGTGGSAVAVLPEPITNPGEGMGWADAELTLMRQAAINKVEERSEGNKRLVGEKTNITTSMVRAKF